jgi:hypothetical protein
MGLVPITDFLRVLALEKDTANAGYSTLYRFVCKLLSVFRNRKAKAKGEEQGSTEIDFCFHGMNDVFYS